MKGTKKLLPTAIMCTLQVTLKLIETFVDKCEDLSLVTESLVPAMMDPILGDYARNVPDARYVAPCCIWTVSQSAQCDWSFVISPQEALFMIAEKCVLFCSFLMLSLTMCALTL